MKNLIDLVKTENVGAFRDAVKAELNRRFEKAYENIMGETIERMGMKYHEPSIEESFEVVDETVVDLDEACKDMKPEVEPSDEPSKKDKVEDEKDEVKDSMEESVKKEEDEDEESDDDDDSDEDEDDDEKECDKDDDKSDSEDDDDDDEEDDDKDEKPQVLKEKK